MASHPYNPPAEPDSPPKFDQWAVVELMGRQILAGKVTEEVIAGHGFIRVDVPEVKMYDGRNAPEKIKPAYTRYVNPSSLYALNPCTEEVARAAAASYRVAPPMPLEFDPKRALPEPALYAEPGDDPDFHDDQPH